MGKIMYKEIDYSAPSASKSGVFTLNTTRAVTKAKFYEYSKPGSSFVWNPSGDTTGLHTGDIAMLSGTVTDTDNAPFSVFGQVTAISANTSVTMKSIAGTINKEPYANGTGGISAGTGLVPATYQEITENVVFQLNISTDSYPSANLDPAEGCYYVSCSFSSSGVTGAGMLSYLGFLSDNGLSILESDQPIDSGFNYASNIYIESPSTVRIYSDGDNDEQALKDWVSYVDDFYIKAGTRTIGPAVTPADQTLLGSYNNPNRVAYHSLAESPLLQVGAGTSASRKNAMRLTYNSQMYLGSGGKYNASGADYGEFFEWEDGNPEREDRTGLFVTLHGDRLAVASPEDYILGAVSSNACIVGNSDEEWQGRYLKDDFGRIQYQDVKRIDDGGKPYMVREPVENPEYNPEKPYIPRAERPEWDVVGMMGVLTVRDNGLCQLNEYAAVGENGIAIPADNGWHIIRRRSENVVDIIFR